jgi:hypothetical protein
VWFAATERTSSRCVVWILLLLVASFEVGFAWWMDAPPLLDARLSYSPAELADFARQLDLSARADYRWLSVVDLGFIGLYTVAFCTWLRLLASRCALPPGVAWLGALPGCCDGVESLSFGVLLASTVPEASPAIWVIAVATPLKWVATAVLAVFIGMLEVAIHQCRPQRWTRWLRVARP